MTDDIVLAKIEGIQRCIKRVSDEYSANIPHRKEILPMTILGRMRLC